MPQSKGGNRLEPKFHSNWSNNLGRTKIKDEEKAASAGSRGRGCCPWTNIIQACIFAMFFHRPTMKDLYTNFNYTDKEDWEEMTLEEWRTWLCIDLQHQGEYWKGLEVFLFMMAQRGLPGA